MEITTLGLADEKQAVSTGFSEGRPYLEKFVADPKVMFVGHNTIRADKVALDPVGINILAERFHDTIILHWLNNSHLCKTKHRTD